MGGTFAKETEPLTLTRHELRYIEGSFRALSQDKETLTIDDLHVWKYLADPDFIKYTCNACFRNNSIIRLKPFAKYFYIVVKSNVHEKAKYIVTEIFSNDEDLFERVTTVQMLSFVTSVLRSYCSILSHNKTPEFTSWIQRGVVIELKDLKHYSHFMMTGITKSSSINISDLEDWLYQNEMFCHIWTDIFINLCNHLNPIRLHPHADLMPLPECRFCGIKGSIHSILSIASVMFINEFLPTAYRRTWTLLFSSKLHGENFTFLVTKIIHQGPTIVVVKDEDDYLFGGFAMVSWSLGPGFHGDPGALLFTINPKMAIYQASGINNHFQYLNVGQHTMPNGLGMGGQLGYWGLWLDASFTRGESSPSCTTFSGYRQLSSKKVFQIKQLEVWSVCERMKSLGAISSLGNETVLHTRGEDKFILELGGHHFRSDGHIEESTRRKTSH